MPESISFDKAALAWTLPWDADWVTAVCFLGATRRLAAGNNLGQILLWDLPEKAGGSPPIPIRRLEGHTNVVTRLLATADGRGLISASFDHSIRYWDTQVSATGSATVVLNARKIAEASSPGGKRSGKKVPPPMEAKVQTQAADRVLDGHREWVRGLSLSGDGKLLLSGDDAGQVILWDRAAAKELRRWKVKGWSYALALAPDGKQAAVSERVPLVFDSGRHCGIRLWDATTGQPQRELDKEFTKIYLAAAAYSPDGKVLALGRGGEADGNNGKVFLIDPATGKKIRELTPGHQYGITDLAFHPDGKHLASSGRDTIIRIWDVASGKMVKELGKARGGQFKDWIHAISFSADGRWLAGADMAGSIQVWTFPA
ncbi:MAG TPA: WD40 repeat domain-containing protein [Gemmataceae bacterium]|nr:WD40 repeat domain-containing protein [Gemmataceae bacterium]